jgi:hypothetical protein
VGVVGVGEVLDRLGVGVEAFASGSVEVEG